MSLSSTAGKKTTTNTLSKLKETNGNISASKKKKLKNLEGSPESSIKVESNNLKGKKLDAGYQRRKCMTSHSKHVKHSYATE